MADRTSDLEIFRDKFLHELGESQPDLAGYQDYLKYWKTVEAEAAHTEDLGKLDDWVRDLARDKERVQGLKNRVDTMGGEQVGAAMVQILKYILDLLEGVERRIRRMRDEQRSILGAILWKGGPGTIAKPKPDDKDKKDGKKDATAAEPVKPPGEAMKPPVQKPEKDKKMER